MPVICGLDLETTGLDVVNGHITELGYIIKQVGAKKPMVTRSELLYDPEAYGPAPITPEIEALTGITGDLLLGYGRPPRQVFEKFLYDTTEVDFFVAHNGTNFDRPFLLGQLKKYGLILSIEGGKGPLHPVADPGKWLDSQADIEHTGRSTHLNYIAADMGFLNPFPHSAIFDVATMLKIFEAHDFHQIVERARIPWRVVRAVVSYDNNALAKARRYRWQDLGDGAVFPKCWVKRVKEDKVGGEITECKAAGFEAVVLP